VSPSYPLHIYRSGTYSGLKLETTGDIWAIQSDTGIGGLGAGLTFYSFTAGAYRMVIDGSGNVGIGTTSPGAKLDVVGPAITGSPWLAEVIRFSSVTYPSQYGSIMIDMGGASGGISFGVAGARSLYIAQTSGNVGIGLTNPSYQLQLSSDSAAKPGLPPGPLPLI